MILAAVLAIGSAAAEAAVLTVGGSVGSGQCTHATLQAAIDAAAATPGLDIIRVTRGEFTTQRLIINDEYDLAIEGGFLECGTPVRVDHTTLDGAGASPNGPVIAHTGNGNLTLADLHIRGGDATDATTQFGGGVASSGWGDLTVYRTLFMDNSARYGGGLFARAPFRAGKKISLAGVGFTANAATQGGGGIYAANVDVLVDGEDPSYFAGNHAEGTGIMNGGGAIFALNSDVTVIARQSAAVALMDNNWSKGPGGAIHFTVMDSGDRSLYLANAHDATPVSIINNTSDTFGGAIYIRSSPAGTAGRAYANLVEAVVADNRAPMGAAFYLYADGATIPNRSELGMWARNPQVPLAPQNRLERNLSTQGATIELESSGTLARSSFQIDRGFMVDNIALGGSGLVFGHGDFTANNSVIANNDAGVSPLVYISAGTMRILNSTIADNIRTTPTLFRLFLPDDDMFVHNSIVFQPGVAMLQVADGAGVSLRNLLIGSGHGLVNLAARNIHETSDPRFQNANLDDYRLRPDSPAIDRWAPSIGILDPQVDLLGATRPAPPHGPTPYDMGAYEYGAVVDPIFSSPFETVALTSR